MIRTHEHTERNQRSGHAYPMCILCYGYVYSFVRECAQCTYTIINVLYVRIYVGEVMDCNEGVCIPDLANVLNANCLCPKNTSGQLCEICKCNKEPLYSVVFNPLLNFNC